MDETVEEDSTLNLTDLRRVLARRAGLKTDGEHHGTKEGVDGETDGIEITSGSGSPIKAAE